MPVIGATVSVLADGASELGHRQHDNVGHPLAQIGCERGDAACEIVEPGSKQSLSGALVDVSVPAADLCERDLESEIALDQLGDLPQCLAERAAGYSAPCSA